MALSAAISSSREVRQTKGEAEIGHINTAAPVNATELHLSLAVSPFTNLPAEIMRGITYYLPDIDVASFSLSAKLHLQLLGEHHLEIFRHKALQLSQHRIPRPYCDGKAQNQKYNIQLRTIQELQNFKRRLTYDLPDVIWCPDCPAVHKVTAETKSKYLKSSYDWSRWRAANSTERVGLSVPWCVNRDRVKRRWSINPAFSSTLFFDIMKRFRAGLPYDDPNLTLGNQFSQRPDSNRASRWFQADLRLLAAPGIMLHRLQQVHLIFDSEGRLLFPEFTIQLCEHFYLGTTACSAFLATTDVAEDAKKVREVRWGYRGTLADRGRVRFSLFACEDCSAEFRVNFKWYPGRGIAVFTTRWKNLGDGVVDDDRVQYREQTLQEGWTHFRAGRCTIDGVSISKLFEREGGVEKYKFDNILTANGGEDIFVGHTGSHKNITELAKAPKQIDSIPVV